MLTASRSPAGGSGGGRSAAPGSGGAGPAASSRIPPPGALDHPLAEGAYGGEALQVGEGRRGRLPADLQRRGLQRLHLVQPGRGDPAQPDRGPAQQQDVRSGQRSRASRSPTRPAAFVGHAVCDDVEWLNGLSNPVGESYHPNVAGHSRRSAPPSSARPLTGSAFKVSPCDPAARPSSPPTAWPPSSGGTRPRTPRSRPSGSGRPDSDHARGQGRRQAGRCRPRLPGQHRRRRPAPGPSVRRQPRPPVADQTPVRRSSTDREGYAGWAPPGIPLLSSCSAHPPGECSGASVRDAALPRPGSRRDRDEQHRAGDHER